MSCFTTQISDGIARLELNLPGEPVNKISRAVQLELESLLDSLGVAGVRVPACVLPFPDRGTRGSTWTELRPRASVVADPQRWRGLFDA